MVRKGSKLQRIHAAQPSLADLVQAGDDDYLSEEGVDGDFKHVLGEINAFSKRNPETFIGSPKAISTSVADDTLRQYLLGIQSDNPEASFTALIPIAYEQYHWVLAIVTLEHGYFEDAVLYDALDGTHSGFDTFQGIMLDLGIDASKISTEFTGEQQDDFRCFDYVCRRMMIETDNSDHPIVTAETAELLRLQVCKTMGVRLNKPIKLEQDETKLIIDESDPDAAMLRALLTKLSKKHPELDPTRDIKFNLSGALTVSQAKPVPTVSSEEDDVKLYLRDSKNEQQNAEEKFQTHFDDSSDEDDDGGELTEKDLFERARPLVKKYRKKKSKPANTADEDTISFMLYILGVMVLRSNGVKPYWHYLKNKHLKMTDAEYQAFKKSVIDAFAVQYEYDAQGRQCFEQQYWKTFLTSFRQHAKYSQDDREVILLKAVTDIVSVLSTKGSQNDIDIVANTVATKINLPNWSPAGKISVGFPDKQYANKKFQLLAITLLQHRITRRTWKAEEGGGTVTLEAGLHGVDCKIKVGLNRDVKSRTDELKQVGAYPNILDPATAKKADGKEHKGKQASIEKFVTEKKLNHQDIANRMLACLVKSPGTDSYGKFITRLTYLMMQVESARHPGATLLGLMALKLIADDDTPYSFKHIFPKDKAQRELNAKSHPEALFPMALSGAPAYAVALNSGFFGTLRKGAPELIYRYDEHKDASKTNRDKFAKLQQNLVFRWLKDIREMEKPPTLSDETVLTELCQFVQAEFSSGKKLKPKSR